MLIEFRVGNFKCFRDEAVLSLIPAGADNALRGNIWRGRRQHALKSAALFGPNASGKTLFLDALYALRQLVITSATAMTEGDPIPGAVPFRLSAAARREPSVFEVQLELDGHGYRYRVEATRERIWRERLEHQAAREKARWVVLIDRDAAGPGEPRITLHERLGSRARRETIVAETRANALMLSRAAERNNEAVKPLFQWFRSMRHSAGAAELGMGFHRVHAMAEKAAKDPVLLAKLGELVRDADTGIAALRPEQTAYDGITLTLDIGDPEVDANELASSLRQAIANLDRGGFRFRTEHRGADGDAVSFDFTQESLGTLRYLVLAGGLLEFCDTPGLMVVDELETSLHPQLAQRIVQLFHSPEFNRAGAQLLFSTHDVTLMDPRLFRRDQVFITQKGAEGASELYSLWDFDDTPRGNAAWAKNYLAGRFGGVPVLGPQLADVPQESEPTRPAPASASAAAGEE